MFIFFWRRDSVRPAKIEAQNITVPPKIVNKSGSSEKTTNPMATTKGRRVKSNGVTDPTSPVVKAREYRRWPVVETAPKARAHIHCSQEGQSQIKKIPIKANGSI